VKGENRVASAMLVADLETERHFLRFLDGESRDGCEEIISREGARVRIELCDLAGKKWPGSSRVCALAKARANDLVTSQVLR
jgi:hypothetical protein